MNDLLIRDWKLESEEFDRVIMERTPHEPKPGVGVNHHGLWDNYWSSGSPTSSFHLQLEALVEAGVKLVRTDVGWDRCFPSSTFDPNNFYMKRLDTYLTALNSRGIKVLIIVHQTPAWMRPGTTSAVKQFPTDLAAWKTSLQQAAQWAHGRVYAWQVWNEPNLAAFTGISGDHNAKADKYAPVLKSAYEGLKGGDPDALVIFGGPSLSDGSFIDACYYRGVKDHFDVMAWHPYQGNGSKNPYETDSYDMSRVTFAPSIFEHMAWWRDIKPVWWTEVGVSVHSNTGIPSSESWRYGVPSDAQAAQYLRDYLDLAAGRYAQVENVFVYVSTKTTGDTHQDGYSIMFPDGTPKPQLDALSEYIKGL